MDGLLDRNNEQGQFRSGDVLATAPPPPTEVKIRTMKSDIASMAASGGGMPQFEKIQVAGLALRDELKQAPAAAVAQVESKGNLLLIIVLVITLAALALVGWLVYAKLYG